MKTLSISLPEETKAFLDEQVAKGGYASASDYLQALLREARDRVEEVTIEQQLLKGLDSGESTPMTAQDWAEIRREGLARLGLPENE